MKFYPMGAELFHADGQTCRSQKSLFTIFRMRLETDNYKDTMIRMTAVCITQGGSGSSFNSI